MEAVKRWYYLYEVWTGLYMLDSWEKLLFNSVVVAGTGIGAYFSMKMVGIDVGGAAQ